MALSTTSQTPTSQSSCSRCQKRLPLNRDDDYNLIKESTRMKPTTIQGWIEAFPEPLRSLIKNNSGKKDISPSTPCSSAHCAIDKKLAWGETKEGHGFWAGVHVALGGAFGADSAHRQEYKEGFKIGQAALAHLQSTVLAEKPVPADGTIPATAPLTHNSAYVLNRAQQILSYRYYVEFLNDPAEFQTLLQTCISELKSKDEFYCMSTESFLRCIPQQIQAWAKLQLSANPECSEEASTQTPQQTPTMNYSDKPVATPTLVFGTDVADMSAEQCISAIQGNNKSIKTYEETGISSPYIVEKINGLKAANEVLVKRLDSFASTPAA